MTVLRRRIGDNWRTVSGAVVAAVPPGQVRFVGAVAPNSAAADVAWLPPFTGGSPLTGYRITVSPGGATHDYGPSITAATIAGLTNGTEYTFTIHATNAIGTGVESNPTAPVTPSAESLIRRDATNTGVLGVFDGALGRNLTYADLTVPTPSSTILPASTPGGTDYVTVDAVGNVTIRRSGFTLYRYDVLGEVVIRPGTDNVTIDQCRIRVPRDGAKQNALRWMTGGVGGPPRGLLVRDTELDGQGYDGVPDPNYPNGPRPFVPSGWVPAICQQAGFNGFTWQRVNVRRWARGMNIQDNTPDTQILIEDCFINDFKVAQGTSDITHNGGHQIANNGGYNITVRRNTYYDWDPTSAIAKYATSAIGTQFGSFPKNPDGTLKAIVKDVLFEDNFFDGGHYCFNAGLASALEADNIVFRRNRVGLHMRYGARSTFYPAANGYTAVWEPNNVWDASGVTDFGKTVLAGEIIP